MRHLFRSVSAVALTASLVMGVGGVASAKVTRVEQADRVVKHPKRVVYVEPVQRHESELEVEWYVEFRDGSTFLFTPCEYEDSRNCYWDAETAGFGGGSSFVDLRGRQHFLTRGSGK